MAEIRNYKDLQVWQEGMTLVSMVYGLTESLPTSERFCLTQQMCRAAVSVPANIAEGHGSSHRKVYTNHLSVSKGSLMEVETYVLLTVQLGYLQRDRVGQTLAQIQRVGMLLSALIRSLTRNDSDPNPEPRIPNP